MFCFFICPIKMSITQKVPCPRLTGEFYRMLGLGGEAYKWTWGGNLPSDGCCEVQTRMVMRRLPWTADSLRYTVSNNWPTWHNMHTNVAACAPHLSARYSGIRFSPKKQCYFYLVQFSLKPHILNHILCFAFNGTLPGNALLAHISGVLLAATWMRQLT